MNGNFQCFTLEDVVRDLKPDGSGKIWGQTAIPAGTYPVILSMSAKFGRVMPRLLDVPFFTGILIHKGNTDQNTEGCILVANHIGGPDLVTDATGAFNDLFAKLQAAWSANESISIEVINDFDSVTP